MATATTPADLIRAALDTLSAARVAETVLAGHPDLPVARMHACGVDDARHHGPLLEIQLDDNLDAVAEFASRCGVEVQHGPTLLNRIEHKAITAVAGVAVWVTAYEDTRETSDGRDR